MTINGRRQYLWRAVDQDGTVLDILVQSRRDAKAAKRFFRKIPQEAVRVSSGAGHRQAPQLRSGASGGDAVGRARAIEIPELNRAENSHQQRERAMKRFRTPGGTQRLLAVFSVISPHFRPRRHRLTADDYRTEMTCRFAVWNEVTGLTAAA